MLPSGSLVIMVIWVTFSTPSKDLTYSTFEYGCVPNMLYFGMTIMTSAAMPCIDPVKIADMELNNPNSKKAIEIDAMVKKLRIFFLKRLALIKTQYIGFSE